MQWTTSLRLPLPRLFLRYNRTLRSPPWEALWIYVLCYNIIDVPVPVFLASRKCPVKRILTTNFRAFKPYYQSELSK